MRFLLLALCLASCTSPYKDWESYSTTSVAAPPSSCSTRLTLGGGLSTRCPSSPDNSATPTK
ncbi:MAG: hypothetical protein LW823_05300 [Rickettsiales bacterium]|nr:hypothetical protein [Rickettsiales bacterium]